MKNRKRFRHTVRICFLLCSTVLSAAFIQCHNTASYPDHDTIYHVGWIYGKGVATGFPRGDSNYHALYHASDGKVYFGVSSHREDTHVHFFRYDPDTEDMALLADIGDVLGEEPGKAVPQGKIHTEIIEDDGRIFFGTHAGFYSRGGTETLSPYPGGHFMSYDLAGGVFTDYGIGIAEDGIITMAMDRDRDRLYAFSWPTGVFMYYDLGTGVKKSFGPSVEGHMYDGNTETGMIPRSVGIDPRDGSVYWWNMNEKIVRYRYGSDDIETLEDHNLSRQIIAAPRKGPHYDHSQWRSIRWNGRDGKFYGVTYFTEHLFSYDPSSGDIEIIDRIAAGPNRRSGNVSGHASIAFDLSQDGRYIVYAPRSGGIHIVTYDLLLRRYADHGVIRLDDGRVPGNNDSLEIGRNGDLYLVCTVTKEVVAENEKKNATGRFRDTESVVAEGRKEEVVFVSVKNPLFE